MRQKILLEKLQQNPVFQTLVTRLDLVLVTNPAHDAIIAAKVNQIASTPLLPRTILPDCPSPFDQQYAINYLTTIYGPRPWKYPLPTAPF